VITYWRGFTHTISRPPLFGAILGVGCGIATRIWKGDALSHKVASHLVQPFFPYLNQCMQFLFVGAGKYILSVAPLMVKIASALYSSYTQQDLAPLQDPRLHREIVFALCTWAISLLLVFSHAHLALFLNAFVGIDLGDISDHILVVFACAVVFGEGLHLYVDSILGILLGIFLFNTTLYYHTVIESVIAAMMSVAICGGLRSVSMSIPNSADDSVIG